jgi:hypothetical protein
MKILIKPGFVLAAVLFSMDASGQAAKSKTSGVYLTAADFTAAQLSYQGFCGSGAHKLELHDVLNTPYIDVTHDHEKRRYSKSDLFGFRACDGRDYRFGGNLEYQILEAKALYIYARQISEARGKTFNTRREYYFSVGPEGQILALTLNNLKQAFPDNHKFHDSLDMTFGAGQDLAQYDDFHKMFKVNRLLIASRERP